MFFKKAVGIRKKFAMFNTPVLKSLLNKVAGRKACTLFKRTPTHMSSGEYCEISKNTYFKEHLHTAAFEVTLGSDCFGLSFWTVAFKTILTY